MKKEQWITIAAAGSLVVVLYVFGRTVPEKKPLSQTQTPSAENTISVDSILSQAKRTLTAGQVNRLNSVENSVIRGDVKEQQLKVYHQLAHFWLDTGRIFEPYAWYEAEAARLENSEKSLTFAAHLFLENLRGENNPDLRTWKGLQAKDLFERSLKINPANDSSIIGLGATYIFSSIEATPMVGIQKVLAVANRDSTNVFAQEVLGHGSMLSGQYDKAINRFQTVYRLSKQNAALQLQSSLMIADAFERKGEKLSAVEWYEQSIPLIKNEEIRTEVQNRINILKK